VYFSGPKILFYQTLVTFKEVIWHQMLTLKNKGLGKVAPGRVGVGDGILVRLGKFRLFNFQFMAVKN